MRKCHWWRLQYPPSSSLTSACGMKRCSQRTTTRHRNPDQQTQQQQQQQHDNRKTHKHRNLNSPHEVVSPHGPVEGGGQHRGGVWREPNGSDRRLVLGESHEAEPARCRPQLHLEGRKATTQDNATVVRSVVHKGFGFWVKKRETNTEKSGLRNGALRPPGEMPKRGKKNHD